MSEMAEAIRALALDKGISEDLVKRTIENSIKAAYKKAYGTDENCIVKFADDLSDVTVYARKLVVDGVYDPHLEIELEDAKKLSDEAEVGDEIDIVIDPKDFGRYAVTQGKQKAHQDLREGFRDNLYNEYKSKIGEQIIGYIQREYNDNIYVDLGKENKVEGVLPKKFRSPREIYEKGGRIKALITDIRRSDTGIQLVLSRTDPKLVQDFLEAEVPEISEKIIEVKKIVREAGYRTKIAVYTSDPNIDPVGACVGKQGSRIQNVIQQLDGEKIDVIPYDEDPHIFIANALTPAKVLKVVILDSAKREALAIVDDEEFSIAIGKLGLNVRLANRLVDWNIDVKSESQASELDLSETSEQESRRAAEELFADVSEDQSQENQNQDEDDESEENYSISSLPEIDERIANALKEANLDDIQDFLDAVDDGSVNNVENLSKEDIDFINDVINKNFNIEDASDEDSEE